MTTTALTADQPFTAKAAELLADAEAQLTSAPHFGALGLLLQRDNEVIYKREYVQRVAAKLFALKLAKPGAGLSSHRNFPPDENNAWAGLEDWTGLDICQAWAVLLSAGHLFGTFASERALLFQLDRDLAFRDAFVRAVTEWDRTQGNRFRARAENLIDRATLHSFHYLLALVRLRSDGVSTLDERDRIKAARLIIAFVSPPGAKLKNLKHHFRRIRQLTYLRMHTELPDEHTLVDGHRLEEDLARLFPLDAILGGDFVDAGKRWDVLNAVDRLEADELFNSPAAAAAVLTHLDEFNSWWAACGEEGPDLLKVVDRLLTKPDDWESAEAPTLKHVTRIQLPTRVGWLHEVRLWRRDDDQDDPWGNATFLVTPTAHDDGVLVLDIYAPETGLPIAATKHLIRHLSRALSVAHGAESNKTLWMTVARLIATLFSSCLKPGYRLRLTPVPGRNGRIGYGTVASTYELARGVVKRFIVDSDDKQRAVELRQLLAVADRDGDWRRRTVVLMASTEVLDRTGRAVTDLDGLIGKFVGDELRWTVMETKKVGASDPKRQLEDRADEYLATDRGDTQEEVFNRQKVAWFQTASPPLIIEPTELETEDGEGATGVDEVGAGGDQTETADGPETT